MFNATNYLSIKHVKRKVQAGQNKITTWLTLLTWLMACLFQITVDMVNVEMFA